MNLTGLGCLVYGVSGLRRLIYPTLVGLGHLEYD